MGNRLSKIYTRTGDTGETGLGDGARVSKTHLRIAAMGDIDELNSSMGMLVEMLAQQSEEELTRIADFLRKSQHRVFDLGGELSIPGFAILTDEHVGSIETELDKLNEKLEPLKNFILPGGSMLIAQAHLARAICRRAERSTVALANEEEINPCCQQFLNRMSDYLFVVARSCAGITGVNEVLWEKG